VLVLTDGEGDPTGGSEADAETVGLDAWSGDGVGAGEGAGDGPAPRTVADGMG
jgi:hypothetical protein